MQSFFILFHSSAASIFHPVSVMNVCGSQNYRSPGSNNKGFELLLKRSYNLCDVKIRHKED